MKNFIKTFIISSFLFSLFFSLNTAFAFNYEWKPQPGSDISSTLDGGNFWNKLTASNDFTKMAAVKGNFSYVYISTDGGKTWIERTGLEKKGWLSITFSGDGTKLIASTNSEIYVSSDDGLSWATSTFSRTGWIVSVVSSYDGSNLVAITSDGTSGEIYTSSDSGKNWIEKTTALRGNWEFITSSQDGTKLAVTEKAGVTVRNIYTSTTSGKTWVKSKFDQPKPWTSLASSHNGENLIAVASSVYEKGYIYTSSDWGETWTEQTDAGQRDWKFVDSSADGKNLVASSMYDNIYTSPDSGKTWFKETTTDGNNWHSLKISAVGDRILAAKAWIVYTGEAADLRVEKNNFVSVDNSSNSISFFGKTNIRNIGRGVEYCASGEADTVCSYDKVVEEYGNFDAGNFGLTAENLTPNIYYQYRFFAENENGRVYSKNYSVFTGKDSWTSLEAAKEKEWVSITSSKDGTKLVAATKYGSEIYISEDSGVSWTTKTIPYDSWSQVNSSSNGKYVALAGLNSLHFSSDFGNSWSIINKPNDIKYWFTIDLSENGQILSSIAQSNIDNVLKRYISLDGGKIWTSNIKELDDEILIDGKKIFTMDRDEILVSNNYGKTWEKIINLPNLINLNNNQKTNQISADLNDQKIFFVQNFNLFISNDINGGFAGVTMPDNKIFPTAVAGGNFGKNIYIASKNGYIYVYGEAFKPEISLKSVRSADSQSLEFFIRVNTDHTKRGVEICKTDKLNSPCEYKDFFEEVGNFNLGEFKITVTDLLPNSYYNYRFFAENEKGKSYSEEHSLFLTYTEWKRVEEPFPFNVSFSKDRKEGDRMISNDNNSIYISDDYGKKWNEIPFIEHMGEEYSYTDFTELSRDGKMILAKTNVGLYTSNNLGESWARVGDENFYRNFYLTSDNKRILAIGGEYGNTLFIYDYNLVNNSWEKTSQENTPIDSYTGFITGTADDSKLFSRESYGTLLVSYNRGDDWEPLSSGLEYTHLVTSSADGKKLVASGISTIEGSKPKYIKISNDGGKTWNEVTSLGLGYWGGVSLSNDGYKIVITNQSTDYVYTSVDGGKTWNKQTGIPEAYGWRAIASGSGEYIIAQNRGMGDEVNIFVYHNKVPQAQNVNAKIK